jgi:hypothetical protein
MSPFSRPLSKRTFWLLVVAQVLILLLVVGLVLLFRGHRPPRVSPVYERYDHSPGITATFVKDFPLNDTLFVDVTLLQAFSDSAWHLLSRDFDIDDLPGEYQEPGSHYNSFSISLVPKSNPMLPMDTTIEHNDVLVADIMQQTISIFHIVDPNQLIAIINRKVINITN